MQLIQARKNCLKCKPPQKTEKPSKKRLSQTQNIAVQNFAFSYDFFFQRFDDTHPLRNKKNMP